MRVSGHQSTYCLLFILPTPEGWNPGLRLSAAWIEHINKMRLGVVAELTNWASQTDSYNRCITMVKMLLGCMLWQRWTCFLYYLDVCAQCIIVCVVAVLCVLTNVLLFKLKFHGLCVWSMSERRKRLKPMQEVETCIAANADKDCVEKRFINDFIGE